MTPVSLFWRTLRSPFSMNGMLAGMLPVSRLMWNHALHNDLWPNWCPWPPFPPHKILRAYKTKVFHTERLHGIHCFWKESLWSTRMWHTRSLCLSSLRFFIFLFLLPQNGSCTKSRPWFCLDMPRVSEFYLQMPRSAWHMPIGLIGYADVDWKRVGLFANA